MPSMANRHGGGYKSNSASESSTTAISMQMHRNPPHVQQGCGGRPANAMQIHSNWKQMLPVRQDVLPAWSRPSPVLRTPLLSAMQGGTWHPARSWAWLGYDFREPTLQGDLHGLSHTVQYDFRKCPPAFLIKCYLKVYPPPRCCCSGHFMAGGGIPPLTH